MRPPCQLLRPVHLHGGWWLLAAAWFCATLPAAVWIDLLHSVRTAMVFSHQAELAAEVSALLHPAAPPAGAVAKAAPAPSRKTPPAVEAAVRKFELPLPVFDRLAASVPASPVWRVTSWQEPAGPVREVPYPPPRGRA